MRLWAEMGRPSQGGRQAAGPSESRVSTRPEMVRGGVGGLKTTAGHCACCRSLAPIHAVPCECLVSWLASGSHSKESEATQPVIFLLREGHHRTPLAAVSLKLAWLPVNFTNKPAKHACFAFCHSCDKTPQLQSCPRPCHLSPPLPPFQNEPFLSFPSFSCYGKLALRSVSGARVTLQTHWWHRDPWTCATGHRGATHPRTQSSPMFWREVAAASREASMPGECPSSSRAGVTVGGDQTGVVSILLLERAPCIESMCRARWATEGRLGMGDSGG